MSLCKPAQKRSHAHQGRCLIASLPCAPATIWFPIGDRVASRSFTPGHLSSGAAYCASSPTVTITRPPYRSRLRSARPGKQAAREPPWPAARLHHEPCRSRRQPGPGRDATERASANAGGKCNKDCRGLRQRSPQKCGDRGVQQTRDTTVDSHASCRPQQTCGNAIFDPRGGCNNPPQLEYPGRRHDCAFNRFHWCLSSAMGAQSRGNGIIHQ